MKLFDILTNVKHELISGENIDITEICMDTRKIVKGCLFVCIKGMKLDRHESIQEAINKQAAAVLIEHDVICNDKNIAIVKVDNTRMALGYIAKNFYKELDGIELIGVTGTNGKTSTTYFLEAIFKEINQKVGVIGTTGVRIDGRDTNIVFDTATTPDTIDLMKILETMREENTYQVVMEVSSHALALYKVDALRFKIGIFTNLTQDHLDFHENMENYYKAKEKLFDISEFAVINADDKAGLRIKEHAKCKILTYGISSDCDLKAINVKYSAAGCRFSLQLPDDYSTQKMEIMDIWIPIPGKFNVYNGLAAIGAALCLGIAVEKIQQALANLKNVPGRIQNVENNKGINVIVDYAHSPDSLLNIIIAVREFTERKLIVVFGCGGDKDKGKREIMGRIAGSLSDYVILTSDNPRSEEPMSIIKAIENGVLETDCKYEKISDRKEAIGRAISIASEGDSVIIAGKGHENYQIFAERTIRFDDVKVAEEFLIV